MSLPGDRIYLFDTSIWDHTKHPLIAPDWDAALEHNQLAVSPIVAFEVLYGAQNQADFEALERQLDALQQAPLTQGIVRDARRALHDLSGKASHRLPFQDALIAGVPIQASDAGLQGPAPRPSWLSLPTQTPQKKAQIAQAVGVQHPRAHERVGRWCQVSVMSW